MLTEEPYCGSTLPEFGKYFRENIHGFISTKICFIGAILNLLNLVVFTRKTMISPANLIFAHLAFVSSLVLLARIPLVWIKYVRYQHDHSQQRTYGWAVFTIYCDTFIVTFQFISAFLTVQLAAWRYIAVVHPLTERYWCNMKMTFKVIIVGYVMCCVLLGVPMHLSRNVKTININHTSIYIVDYKRNSIAFPVAFIMYGFLGRILPAIVLAVLTIKLVVTLLTRKSNREQMTPSTIARNRIRNVKLKKQTNRSTTIMLTVVILFFIAEFPKGILSLLRAVYEFDGIFHTTAHQTCYTSLIQIFNTITDINLAITFIVYYILSEHFRFTFKSLFSCSNASRQTQTSTYLTLSSIKKIDTGSSIVKI
ncbi:sex peptide receptor-related protein 2-like [Planococcus citri]|uniref:sex peptide receptor-related protein 2-like n=1 Tax=Planococcus citri TaxID=170843 RepID=UPI0031F9F735